ncbi:outer membrane beta-barrel protein [Alteromonas sp. 345S023]|uniref:Outer membrane beta-barrel protein n=1 Tax=Alteromonas profundi TaxID=2696062 RepID=A0A7X5LIG0_9ALTE|nr:outer membrane beta-barrel protein [Alteromonas profundi]NDV89946.1 outer membrane beta-barrel protein [Alteromonas profundi]
MFIRKKIYLAVSATFVMFSASAQQEAGRIEYGSFDIIPTFNTSLSYLDNITRTTDEDAKINSWRAVFAPKVVLATQVNNNPVEIGYRIARGEFLTSTDDDYTDHFITASGDFELNSRHRLDASALYEDGHEARGTGLSIGTGENLSSPDTYKSSLIDVNYSYGSLTSDGMLTFSVSRNTLDYDREEESYLIRDRFINKFGGEFSYRVAPSTFLVFDVAKSYVRYDYQPADDASRDSDGIRILVGARWESTAATTGFAKVGYQEKDFESQDRDNFYGTDWEVGVDWRPLEYTTFRLSTSADTRETNGEGNFIRSRNYSASWNHDWYDYLSTSAGVTFQDNTYTLSGQDVAERNDDFTILSLSADYSARRWLNISVFYEYTDLASNRDTLGYDTNTVGVAFEVTL